MKNILITKAIIVLIVICWNVPAVLIALALIVLALFLVAKTMERDAANPDAEFAKELEMKMRAERDAQSW